MPKAVADPTAPERIAERPRKWGNRRPVSKRLDLTPGEAEKRAQKKVAGRRTKFIGAFVTEAEKETVATRSIAYGMKQSDFIRTVLLSGLKEPPPPRTDPAAVRALAFELSKVGTNLNQLARVANEAAKLGGDKDARALLAMETELRRLGAQLAGTMSQVIEL